MVAEACHILREVGDRDALSNTLNRSAALALEQGDSVVAQALLEDALATAREIGQRCAMSIALSLLGQVALGAGDVATAHAHYVEALKLVRDRGPPGPITGALRDLGGWLVAAGNPTGLRGSRRRGGYPRERLGRVDVAPVQVGCARRPLRAGRCRGASRPERANLCRRLGRG